MRVSLQEFYCEIYCHYCVPFFFSFLLAELAEYVLKDQQEKQVEDTFGKIHVAKINFLHDSVLANIWTVLRPQNLNTSKVSVHLISSSFPLGTVSQDFLGRLWGFSVFLQAFLKDGSFISDRVADHVTVAIVYAQLNCLGQYMLSISVRLTLTTTWMISSLNLTHPEDLACV